MSNTSGVIVTATKVRTHDTDFIVISRGELWSVKIRMKDALPLADALVDIAESLDAGDAE